MRENDQYVALWKSRERCIQEQQEKMHTNNKEMGHRFDDAHGTQAADFSLAQTIYDQRHFKLFVCWINCMQRRVVQGVCLWNSEIE